MTLWLFLSVLQRPIVHSAVFPLYVANGSDLHSVNGVRILQWKWPNSFWQLKGLRGKRAG